MRVTFLKYRTTSPNLSSFIKISTDYNFSHNLLSIFRYYLSANACKISSGCLELICTPFYSRNLNWHHSMSILKYLSYLSKHFLISFEYFTHLLSSEKNIKFFHKFFFRGRGAAHKNYFWYFQIQFMNDF